MWQIANIQLPAGQLPGAWMVAPAAQPERPDLARGGFVLIDFAEGGNSAYFREEGWSGQERELIWGTGPRSRLRIPFQAAGQAVVLEADICPCRMHPEIAGQIVRIRVNGTPVGDTRLDERTLVQCEIDPAIAGTGGILEVDFEFPGFFRPGAFRQPRDQRPLSGAFFLVRAFTKDMSLPAFWRGAEAGKAPLALLCAPLAEPPADARPVPAVAYGFGVAGTANPFLRDGWHRGEEDTTWTIATSAQIELPGPAAPGRYALRLDINPMVVPGAVPSQEVSILLDRIVVGQYRLDEPAVLIVPLPRELTEGQFTLKLNFVMPDACRPIDHGVALDRRLLGLAFRRIDLVPIPARLAGIDAIRAEQAGEATPIASSGQFLAYSEPRLVAAIGTSLGTDPATLLKAFESLGNNCEFGVAQRKMGVEVLNLFRFGNVPFADLMAALSDDLSALNEPGAIEVKLNHAEPREYMLCLRKYNIHWHTFMQEQDADAEKILRDHTAKLAYLRRKFFEGLSGGQKTYVVKRPRGLTVSQASALLIELNRHGPAKLLCVQAAPPGRRSGEVDLIVPGLMRGYLDRFAPEDDVESTDAMAWLRLTANAALLLRDVRDRTA